MSPIPFGTPPVPLVLPEIDVSFLGSVMLTVWQIANQNDVILIAFLLALATGLLGWLISFVIHRHNAPVSTFDIGDYIESEYGDSWKENISEAKRNLKGIWED
jgi:hypothetical protein